MPALGRALAIAMLCATPAAAERVLLADADPELQRAIRATLAPWRVEVVVAAEVRPRDATEAQQIGDAKTARFVVWREGNDLVVFDRESHEVEHRGAPAGPLDAASAAAAALTVKTLMRLPAPPADAPPPRADAIVTAPPRDAPGPELRVEAGVASRIARGTESMIGTRASLAVLVRPFALPLRLGLGGDVGTEADVDDSGFKGAWSDWRVLGLASWSFALAPRWALEPFAGAGVARSSLDGTEGMMVRHERALLGALRAGLAVRWQRGVFSVGGAVAVDALLGTPTYTKAGMGQADVFQVPETAVSLGFIVAADLGR